MFSVRSESDLGVGEFLDLKLLVDWAVDSGFHLVQLLPINDTSVHGMWWDSYPYRYMPSILDYVNKLICLVSFIYSVSVYVRIGVFFFGGGVGGY
jgi:4-alpha-glucanotransferase